MKLLLFALGLIILLVAVVVFIGALLPKHHIVQRTRFFDATPDQVFRLISGPQEWRTDLKDYKLYDEFGRHMARETDKHGQTITYEVIESRSPTLLKRTIADKNLPFGGSWAWSIQPKDAGSLMSITEDGEVYNPVFRFVSQFIIGATNASSGGLPKL
jgi:hypothetical protein